MQQHSVKKNIIYNVVYTGSNVIFPFIISMYVSRILGAAKLGEISYAQTIVLYFVDIAMFGVQTYGLREIAKVRDNRRETDKLFSEMFTVQGICSLLMSLIFITLVLTIPGFSRGNKALFFVCGIQLFFNLINVDFLYQGQEDYKYITIRSITIKLISFICIILIIKEPKDFIVYAAMVTFATVGNYIFNIVYSKNKVHYSLNGLDLKKHLKPLAIFFINGMLGTLYSRIDITMLGIMSTNAAIGYYSYAQKTINIAISICVAATAVFMPRLSYYYQNEREMFLRLLENGLKALHFVLIPMAVGMYILAPDAMILLYGKDFVQSSPTLRIFVFLILIKGYGDLLCWQVSVATNNEKVITGARIIGAITNISLNMLLIPIWAELGAAIASVVSEFLLNVYQLIWSRKTVKYHIQKKSLLQSMLSSIVMGLLIYLICLFSSHRVVRLLGGFSLGVVVYFIANILMKNEFMMTLLSRIKNRSLMS